jgi:hypothetical protein
VASGTTPNDERITLYGPSAFRSFAVAVMAGGGAYLAFVFWMFSGTSFTPPALSLSIGGAALVLPLPFVLVRRRVIAGSDGIHLRFVGVRFVPYAHITRAKPNGDDGVELVLQNGEIVAASGAACKALLDRVWHALEARAQLTVQPAESAYLDRGARSTADWLAELSKLAATASSYRGGGVSRDRLWALVENPSAPPRIRAAAAAALAPVLDRASKQHLRVVAGATARPELRSAIESAMDGAAPAELARTFERLGADDGA